MSCTFAAGSGGGALARFLTGNHDRCYCHTCLAASLDVSREDVTKAVARLRANSQFRVNAAACSACGKKRVTIQAVGPAPSG